jgi:tetratricopeptide (TPR) repeat protein
MLFIIYVFFIRRPYESLLVSLKQLFPFLLTWLIIPLTLLAERSRSIVDLREQIAVSQFNMNNGLTALNVLRTYLWLCLAPFKQNLDYDYPRVQSVWEWQTLLSIILIAGLLLWACQQFKRRRIFSFCVVWFFVSLTMEFLSSALVGKDMIFEHWLYLSLIGFALFIVWGLQMMVRNRILFYAVMVLGLAYLSVLTYQRNTVWKDPVTLWTDVLRKSPRKARPYDNLASAYIEVKNYQAAKQMLYHAIRMDPRNYKTLNNLGLVFLEEGDALHAQEYFEKALRVNPEYAESWSNLGVLYLRTHQPAQAREALLKARSLNPELLEARRNLALMYQQQGDNLRAIEIYQDVLKEDPHEEESLYNLTELYLESGLKPSAMETAQKALARGTDVKRMTALGSRFAAAGVPQTALSFFQKALETDPDYPDAYVELGKFYGNRNDFTRAIATWQDGLHRVPDDPRFGEFITRAELLKKTER